MPDSDRPFQDAPAPTPPVRRPGKAGGVFQAIVGAFLLVLMGVVTVRMAPTLLAAPDALADGSRFNASQGAARLVLGLFGSVLLFGVIAVAVGVRQAATGARPRRLVYLLWGAGALILVLVVLVVLAIKQGQA